MSLLLSLSALLPPAARQHTPPPPNVLLVVLDDFGVDQLAGYGIGADPAHTPNLDLLWSRGVLFRTVWANPLCSPTRATFTTGRYAFRNTVGFLAQGSNGSLPLAEVTLPELLDCATGGQYRHALIGKWHLGNDAAAGGTLAPNLAGWGHYAGVFGNLFADHGPGSPPVDYFHYTEVVDGLSTPVCGEYVTTRTVDNAIAWVQSGPQPWLLQLAFHAPHDPFHAPPPELHTVDLSAAGSPEADPTAHYRAAIEAVDTELGRLLAALGPQFERTVVIVTGDNGTPGSAALPPYVPQKCKATVYEGGVRVPLLVSGPGFASHFAQCEALVNLTDLFATVLELAGVDLATAPGAPAVHDSLSIVPYLKQPQLPSQRQFLYSERFTPNGPGPYVAHRQAIREQRYKLIRVQGGQTEFYDLLCDPFENLNLFGGPLSEVEFRKLRQLQLAADELKPLGGG
jgi:arylsulfatase A-like enzyme